MRESDRKTEFPKLVLKLWSYYSGCGKDKMHAAAKYWFDMLKDFELELISQVFDRLPETNPATEWYRFPNVQDVVHQCRRHLAKQRQVSEQARKEEQRKRDEVEHQRVVASVPDGAEQQKEWVEAADTESERLSRVWLIEAKKWGKTPSTAVRLRMKQLLAAYEKDQEAAERRRVERGAERGAEW